MEQPRKPQKRPQSSVPSNPEPQKFEFSLDRRTFVLGTGGFLLSIIACGGGGVSLTVPSLNFFVKNVSGTVVLPPGVSLSSITLVTGESELTLTQPTFAAQAPGNMPTLVTILDNATGKVIMPCTIDPTLAQNKLDSNNVAATLIFLAIGGWTLKTAKQQIWSEVIADPATVAFGTIVQARLAADPFAASDGDAQIVIGLQAAIAALKIKLPIADPAVKHASTQAHKATAAGYPPLPNPFVYVDTTALIWKTTNSVSSAGLVRYQSPTLPYYSVTYCQYRNPDIIERTFLLAYTTTDQSQLTQIGEPIVMAPGSTGGIITYPIQNIADKYEILMMFIIAPTFDATVHTNPSNLDSTVAGLQVATWERAVLGIATDFIVTALGGTVASHDATLMDAAIQTIKGLSATMTTGFAQADTGKNFAGSISSFLGAAAQPDQNIAAIVEALRPLSTNLPQPISAKRLAQLRSFLGLGASVGLQSLSSQYSQTYLAYIYDPNTDVSSAIEFAGSISQTKIVGTATSTSLDPGGAPTTISFELVGYASGYQRFGYDNGLMKYKYQFTGSANVTMKDSKGNSGNTFETLSHSVELVAHGAVTGKQMVSVELFDMETGTPISIGTSSFTLGIQLQITPGSQTVPPGGNQNFTVSTQDGSALPPNANFKWSVTGSGSITGGNPFTTTQTTITYTAPTIAETETLTVQLLDSGGAVLGEATTGINVATTPQLAFTLSGTPPVFFTLKLGDYVFTEKGQPYPKILNNFYQIYFIGPNATGYPFYIDLLPGGFAVGQTYTYDPVGQGVTTQGTFWFSLMNGVISGTGGTGMLTITNVAHPTSTTTLIQFTFSISALLLENLNGNIVTTNPIVNGTGSAILVS